MQAAELNLVYELSPPQVGQLCAIFEGEWWSVGRDRADIEEVLASSVVVALVHPGSDALVAFARVVTDYHYFACILDVIVHVDYRSHGFGKEIMNGIFRHPELQRLRGIGLQCREEKVGFYEQWGFSSTPGASLQMKRVFADQKPADVAI